MKLRYDEGEIPPFAFCESVAAGPTSLWHVRKVTPGIGLKPSGGIDTPSLCERIRLGWDLKVRVRPPLFFPSDRKIVCDACRQALLALWFERMQQRRLLGPGSGKAEFEGSDWRDQAWWRMEMGYAEGLVWRLQEWLDGKDGSGGEVQGR